jgi:serine/threonine protein kinase
METITDTAPASGPPPGLTVGGTLGGLFQLEAAIGASVYGERYRGRDLSDGQIVVVQVIAPALLADPSVRARLEREVQIAVQLDHKNVGVTYGLFTKPVCYLAAELIDGRTLREMIDQKRAQGHAFSLKGAYNVVAHLCNALIYAHDTTVHGAISADVVMVNDAGRVKLTGFAIGHVLGPLVARRVRGVSGLAPEVASAPERVDARSDVYSIGVLLFELVTGRAPIESFERPSTAGVNVPPALDAVVARCLKPAPEERFADAQALKDALHEAIAADLSGPHALEEPPAAAPVPERPRTPYVFEGPPLPPSLSHATPAVATRRPTKIGALMSASDDYERWLIQKDKLDFGPFSMRDVRSQIETGNIRGEHTIIDTETGDRRKVRDHAQLRELVLHAEAHLEEKARVEQDHHDRRKTRGKMVTMLSLFLVVVLGIGGAIMFKWRPWEKKVEKVVVHDGADIDFSKIEFAMKVDPAPPKKNVVRKPKKNGKPGEFDETTNLGDASEGGGDEVLSQAQVQAVMRDNFKVLVGCIGEERRRNPGLHEVDMDFIIKGTGTVSAVKVNGQTGTPFAGCMYGKMQAVSFPKFNGVKTHASFSLALK